MAAQAPSKADQRVPLTRDRLLRGAVAVADASGIGALTIRSLARELGVKPMAIYHHVANKNEILDGVVDLVFSEIELPPGAGAWRAEMRQRAISARRALGRHPWATTLLSSRIAAGPATLRHHNAVIGSLRNGGFSVAMAAHAIAMIDSYVYGFAMQEATMPFTSETVAGMAAAFLAQFPAAEFPYVAELTTEHVLQPGYDFGAEFEVGLDLVLDGLQRSAAE